MTGALGSGEIAHGSTSRHAFRPDWKDQNSRCHQKFIQTTQKGSRMIPWPLEKQRCFADTILLQSNTFNFKAVRFAVNHWIWGELAMEIRLKRHFLDSISRKEKIGPWETFVGCSLSILSFWNLLSNSGGLALCVTPIVKKNKAAYTVIESAEPWKVNIIPKEKIGPWETSVGCSLSILSFPILLSNSGGLALCVTPIRTSSCTFILQIGKWNELNWWPLRSLLLSVCLFLFNRNCCVRSGSCFEQELSREWQN